MTHKEEILFELQEITQALATISRKNVYSVPLNYFDGLAGNIMQSIKADIAGQSFGMPTQPYSVPEGYFNTLAYKVLSKIKDDGANEVHQELSDIAPVLNTISKKMLYEVPVGYFETFAVDVKKTEEPARIVSISWFKKSYKYAAAAVAACVVTLSAVLFSPKFTHPDETAGTTSSINVNIPAEVDKVSDDEIIEYLSNNSFGPEGINVLMNMPNAELDINHSIRNATDEDIKEYLKQFEEPARSKLKDS